MIIHTYILYMYTIEQYIHVCIVYCMHLLLHAFFDHIV